jgi:hypothetical protein
VSLVLSQTNFGVFAAVEGAVAAAGTAVVVAAGAAMDTDDHAVTAVERAKPQAKDSFVMGPSP